MAGKIDARIEELGIELPQVPPPAGAYVGVVKTGNLLFVAGQVPFWNGEKRHIGKVGAELTVEQGQAAAGVCALNILAQAKAALDGDLDRITRIVKLGGFVNCPTDFEQHPAVINSASNLIGEIFGEEIGAHARFAMGAGSLPFNVAVEIDAVIEFK
ncbi:MAG: RidA family protein [Alphaproteobacteria bacterium]|nr:RidA family protein [Alphaproteobacteria bacterium]